VSSLIVSIILRDNIFHQSKIYCLIGLNAYTNCFHDCEFIEPAEIYFHNNNNIFCDPLFSSGYHLQPNSPCIDAGGMYGEYDPDGTNPDIGAYYYHQPPATPSGFAGVWYNNHPKIYWNAVSEPDLKHYEVWKKAGAGAWALRTTTTATYYVDNNEFKWTKPQPGYAVYYKVRAVDDLDVTSDYTSTKSFNCNAPQSDQEEFYPTVEIDPIPAEFCLHPVYPNPFNISTTIKLDLPEETRFSLVIYDISGKEVWCLNNSRSNTYPAGYHIIQWDGRTNSGSIVTTGVYFIVYRSTEHQLNQKVVLVK